MFFITLCLLFLVATANVEIGKEIKVQEDPDHGLHVSKSNAYRYFNFVRQWSPNGCYHADKYHACKKQDSSGKSSR